MQPVLSSAQLDFYHTNGYLVLEDFATEESCLSIRNRAQAIVKEFDLGAHTATFSTTDQSHAQDEYFLSSAHAVRCFLESGATDEQGNLAVEKSIAVNKIGHAQHDLDPVFQQFSYRPALATLLGQLGYERPAYIQSMYIFKSPGTGGEVVPHCDHSFLWTDPVSVCALWFAVDDATIENGCLWVLPGGHRGAPKTRFRLKDAADALAGTVTDTLDAAPYNKADFTPVEVKRGALVVLHGQLPHFSNHNHSQHPRHAYTLHAIDAACDYLDDNWLQRGDTLRLVDEVV